jgi:hypothetical protein
VAPITAGLMFIEPSVLSVRYDVRRTYPGQEG